MAAGAIGTPHLMELSGDRTPRRARSDRREVLHAIAGLGENLQDHLQLRTIFRIEGARTLNVEFQSLFKRALMGLDYAFNRRGPLTMAPSQLGMFARSSPDYATANVEFHVQPLSLDKFGDPLHKFPAITLSVCNLRPASRGSCPRRQRRSARRAADPAQLSERGRGPARRRRFDPSRAQGRRRALARALQAERISARRRS